MSNVIMQTVNETFSNNNENYIQMLNNICGFDDGDQSSHGAIGMSLFRLKHLLFDPQTVMDCIEKALVSSSSFTGYSITEAFVDIYPEAIAPLITSSELADALQDETSELYYQYSTFCCHTLPQSETSEKTATTKYPNNELTVTSTLGLPYGGIARLIILYVNSMAVKYKSREIDLGKSIKEFVEKLGYRPSYIEGGINSQVLMQLERLFHTTYIHSTVIKTVNSDNEQTIEKVDNRLHLFDTKITWEHIKDTLTTNSVAKIVLSDAYFDEITKHPVPLSLDSIKALKKSPLALDLYAFISYRANSNRLVPAALKDLKRQFCCDKPTYRFKDDLKRALKYVQKEWPECNVILKGDVLLIPKMATHIAKK